MKKIALVTPMLQPYRITFYEKLAKHHPDLHWIIYHGVKKTEDGRPAYKGKVNFDNIGCEEVKISIGPFNIVYLKGLLKEMKKNDPDLVITQGIAGNVSNRMVISWARRKNKKIIMWTCGWEPGLARGLLLRFKNYFVSTFFRKADRHLTYSTKANKYTEGMGVPADRITTCYNGIEIDPLLVKEDMIYDQAKQLRKSMSLEGYVTFLFVGGLIPEKNVDMLIDSFHELQKNYKNIKLIIIGDGPEKQKIQEKLDLLNDERISYLGRIIDGVDKYFAASDCFVLPGVGGLALNQAMFWRKPCIVSEADGTEDDLVKDDVTGFRFIKDDLQTLTLAMEKYIRLSEKRKMKMAGEARKIIVEKSNVNNMVEIFMAGVKELLEVDTEK